MIPKLLLFTFTENWHFFYTKNKNFNYVPYYLFSLPPRFDVSSTPKTKIPAITKIWNLGPFLTQTVYSGRLRNLSFDVLLVEYSRWRTRLTLWSIPSLSGNLCTHCSWKFSESCSSLPSYKCALSWATNYKGNRLAKKITWEIKPSVLTKLHPVATLRP